MKLVVVIRCVDCGHLTTVHVLGGWDIRDYRHECKTGGDSVTFEPRRPIF